MARVIENSGESSDVAAGRLQLALVVAFTVLNTGNIANFWELLGNDVADWPCPVGVPYPDLSLATGLLTFVLVVAVFSAYLRSRSCVTVGMVLANLSVIATVLWPLTAHIAVRHRTGDIRFTHDGGVFYTEQAIQYVLEGRNPYAETYLGTPVEQKFAADPGWQGWPYQPILNFFPYLPFPVLAGLPLYWISQQIVGFYDQRFLYLPALILLMWLVPRLFPRRWRPAAISIALLNPAVTVYFIQGTNDILLMLWIIAGFAALQRRRDGLAAVCWGLASATKQFAWFIWPFALMYWWPESGGFTQRFRGTVRKLWPAFAAAAAVVLPFALWNPKEFLNDAILFNFGLLGSFYPFGGTPGYGFPNILLALGIVPTVHHEFPLAVFQLVVGGAVIIAGMRNIRRERSAAGIMRMTALSLFTFLFFSRMFHYNYFGVISTLVLLGAAPDAQGSRSRHSLDQPAGNATVLNGLK